MSYKKYPRETLCTYYSVPPNGNILKNTCAMAQPGYWQSYNTPIVFRFSQCSLVCVYVCMHIYLVLCTFITCVSVCRCERKCTPKSNGEYFPWSLIIGRYWDCICPLHPRWSQGCLMSCWTVGFEGRVSLSGLPSNAAAAAKSPQLCLALCDPVDGSPPGSSVHGILQARTLEWVAMSF